MATAFDKDTSASSDDAGPNPRNGDHGNAASGAPGWAELTKRIAKRSNTRTLAGLWPNWDASGAPLRWGVAAASGEPVADSLQGLTLLAAGQSLPKRLRIDFQAAALDFCESLGSPGLEGTDQVEVLAWAYALPELTGRLREATWWEVLNRLQTLQHAAAEQASPDSLAHLLLGGELGLVLSWRLADVPSCKALVNDAAGAAIGWFDQGDDSVDTALMRAGVTTRLALAAGLRTQALLKAAAKRKLKASQTSVLWDLATWAAATTNPDGTAVFSAAARGAVREDIRTEGLLLTAAAELDPESLTPAVKAALGQSNSRGRLAWQVSLPEPTLNSEAARFAVMLPEWDVRRGRVHIDYRDEAFRLQVHAGRPMLLDGQWQITITSDGEELAPRGPWTEVCQHTDDDVHYLELEQSWTGDVVVQRQIMVVRDDRCVLLADAVISKDGSPPTRLEYSSRWAVDAGIQSDPEADTWEVIMGDSKPRALALPLSLPEWRVGPRAGAFGVGTDGALELTMQGSNNLYAPLWLDFERSRFVKPRTWRQLTVAEFLRIVTPDEAIAFRVEAGPDQWLIYRSLIGRISRTALGKNLVADFYCGRFDPEDGYAEELVTVDNDPDDAE